MPRYNRAGRVVAGVAGGTVSIDRQPVGPGGGAQWLTEDRIIYGGPHGGGWATLEGPDRPLDSRGPNYLAASDGRWIGQDRHGLFGPLVAGLQLPPEARLALDYGDGRTPADRVGTIAISDVTGRGFTLLAADGSRTSGAPGFPAYHLSIVGPRAAIWTAGQGFDAIGLPIPIALARPGRACWVVVAGAPWIVYYAENVGLVAHPIDSLVGVLIEGRPRFYGYDAIARNGTIGVTFSAGAAELPHEIEEFDLDLSRVEDLRAYLSGPGRPLPPAPVDPPKPEEPKPVPTPEILRDRTADVRQIRRDLFGLGDRDPIAPPGNSALSRRRSFEVVKHLAWKLRAEGWGLVLAKPGSENNVDGYTSDVIALRNGEHVDVISDAEGFGGALWDPVRHRPDFSESWNRAIAPRWAAPIDPWAGGEPIESPVTEPEPAEPPVSDGAERRLLNLEAAAEVQALALEELRQAAEDDRRAVEVLRDALARLEAAAVRSGHAVEVSGAVSLSAALRGSPLTWQGRIK